MTQRTPAINAPDEVVRSWKESAARSMDAANRTLDPAVVEMLNGAPRDARELVVFLVDALRHAAGIALASVANAVPDAAALFADGLEKLVEEVLAEQAGQSGGEEDYCPVPEKDGTGRLCRCGPDGRAACRSVAFDLGAGKA